MTAYAAFLRGILPTNPNMRNDKLRAVFEGLGFRNVATVISSGNVLFESASKDTGKLEGKIEKALFKELGFKSTTFVRSQKELKALAKKDLFKGKAHGKKSYLIVTFLKKNPSSALAFPRLTKGYGIVGTHDRAVASIIDLAESRTPEFMRELEKRFGKEITTRTWKTVERIVAKLDA